MALLDKHGRTVAHDRIGPSVPTRHLYGQDTVSDLLRKHRPALGVELNPPGAGEPPPSAERIVSAPTTSAPAGVNERSRQVAPGRVAGSTNVVSDWLNSRAEARITGSSGRSASATTASGLPVSGVSANTSTRTKGTDVLNWASASWASGRA
jgi:hypothetical protein